MSVAWRLSEVEAAIPFEDVKDSWANRREGWLTKLCVQRGNARQLATLMSLFLDSLKPKSISLLWGPDQKPFVKLREACQVIARGEALSLDPCQELLRLVAELESVAIPPPPASEMRLMGTGHPDILPIGNEGPLMNMGDACHVLDIRMVWCNACVAALRRIGVGGKDDGFMEYRVHYEGWSKKIR